MTWEKTYKYLPQYEYVSTNQHGDRYRQIADKQISCAKLSANAESANDMRHLILLSHHLNVPVHYVFTIDPQIAYIEVMAREAV
ncbi:hypothetical protein LCGC14_0960570 [marine sediment metagenome]|uniref:Uncharacterized protein n=1 Tax=marine sediment metagenome TaxID=412755 RepID=A0A0F9NJA6_9ZZZZ